MRSLLRLDALLSRTVLERSSGEAFELLVKLGIRGVDDDESERDDTRKEDGGGYIELK
jgi:hypothetical protein